MYLHKGASFVRYSIVIHKEFVSGGIYHVFNRGNNKEKIFFDVQDYKAFLFRLTLSLGFDLNDIKNEKLIFLPYSRMNIAAINKNNFKLHSFCLMPNHFHLLIEQCKDEPISRLISKVCTSYAMYINKKYNRVGHVFQDQFKAVSIDDDPQLMWTSSYIHMNPVKDKITELPEQYEWSSYKDFVEERNLPIVSKNFLLEVFGSKNNLKKETLSYKSKDNLEFNLDD